MNIPLINRSKIFYPLMINDIYVLIIASILNLYYYSFPNQVTRYDIYFISYITIHLFVLVLYRKASLSSQKNIDSRDNSMAMSTINSSLQALFIGKIFMFPMMIYLFNELQMAIVFLIILLLSEAFFVIVSRLSTFSTRDSSEDVHNTITRKRLIIYGAGIVGKQLVKIHQSANYEFKLEALFDDNSELWGSFVHRVRISGGIDALEEYSQSNPPEVIIIATTHIDQDKVDRIMIIAEKYDTDIKIVPSLYELQTNSKSIKDIRDMDIADILGRQPVRVDMSAIFRLLGGKIVLITGAGGSIGSEIARQIKSYGPSKLLLLDIDETEVHNLSLEINNYESYFSNAIEPIVCDVRSEMNVSDIMRKYKPDIIFHAAAYKHVPLMEHYPKEAIQNNIIGSYNVLKAAISHDVGQVIIISTDKAVNPTNIMGASKRISELIGTTMSNNKTKIISVRFGNVLGSRGSVLPLFLNQIKEGLPLTVTHRDMIRYFMTIPEAVSLVFLAASNGNGGDVLVLDMGKPVKIYDFAKQLIEKYGDGRSYLKVIGLRPGEKLFEELLTAEEGTTATSVERIYRAKISNVLDGIKVDSVIDEFKKVRSLDIDALFTKYITTYNHKQLL